MSETVDIPKVGALPKKYLVPAGIAVAAFVGWRFWQARQDTSDGDTTITDGEFGAVDTSIPGVAGAVSPTNSYGSGDSGSGDTAGTSLTTNAAWTTYARSQLSGSYDDAAVVAALGNYLGSQPLSSAQQTIVRAAIAVAGYPPVGSFAVIPGGDTTISVAPSGLKAITIRADHVTMGWNPVAGASSYRLYGAGQQVTSSALTATISALASGTSYGFQVAAVNGAGTVGPKSATVTVKTAAAATSSGGTPTGKRGYGWSQVKRGENLTTFALRNLTSAAAIRNYNPAESLNRFTPGEWLRTRANSNPTSGYKG